MQIELKDLLAATGDAFKCNRDGLVALMKSYGVSRVSEVPCKKWATFMGEINALSAGTYGEEFKAAEAERQREAEEKADQDRYARLGPPKAYRSKTFGNYKRETPEQKAAIAAAQSWLYDPEKWRNLVLVGPVGTGKTHLASAVLYEHFFLSGERNFEFISASDLACDFREKKQKESDFFKWYGEDCDLLVIDDLGAIAGATPGELFSVLLDKRTNNDLRTVVTTNANDDDLRRVLTDRGFSRLNSRCMTVFVDGDDYRLKQ